LVQSLPLVASVAVLVGTGSFGRERSGGGGGLAGLLRAGNPAFLVDMAGVVAFAESRRPRRERRGVAVVAQNGFATEQRAMCDSARLAEPALEQRFGLFKEDLSV
jgi:hypothetical protein